MLRSLLVLAAASILAPALAAPAPAAPAPAEAAPAKAGAPQDDEIVREFKKYFRKYKDPDARIEAVLSLLGAETAGVVGALVPVLGDKDRDVAAAAARVLASFETRPPVDALIARPRARRCDSCVLRAGK